MLGHLTSSAAIERDFGISRKFLYGLRNRMDRKLWENVLYLSSNSDFIPMDIPLLECVDVRDCIPGRCRKENLECSDSGSVGFTDVEDFDKEFSSFIAASFHFHTYANSSSKTYSDSVYCKEQKCFEQNIGGIIKKLDACTRNNNCIVSTMIDHYLVHDVQIKFRKI